MSMNHDPDLDDVLQDEELVRLGALLRSTRRAEPPLDEAFRSDLRRRLMKSAWETSEGRTPWWRRSGTPAAPARRAPALAWAGAAAGVLLILSVVVFTANQKPGSNDIFISSPIADAHSVQLQQPILVSFNQPMDHKSTEAAVRIAPATYVAFSWNANTMAVQPTSGKLAPNTQYRVTIGPGAKTQAGKPLASTKTITFVTQPSATPPPSPRPSPRATPTTLLTGEHRLAPLPAGTYAPQWSSDSTTIYFVGANAALQSVGVSDGAVKVIVADGVSFPAIAPAGDRLAYVRGGKIVILTLGSGSTTDPVAAPGLTTLTWAKDVLMWGTDQGIFKLTADGPAQVDSVSQNATVISISPDGAHAVYRQGNTLQILDLATSKSTKLGVNAESFLGWSPDGSRLLYTQSQLTVVASVTGDAIATIIGGEASWSIKDEILVGNDTDIYAIRPDGYGRTRLNGGTYHQPSWAPNGSTFTFVRGGAIWAATSTPLPAEPSVSDQASSVVSSFMNARLQGQPDAAKSYLTDKGKQAYSSSGLPLLITGDATFSRFYVLTQEIVERRPDAARFVVRLVLTKGTLDVSDFEETLTLKRTDASRPFLIDQATAGPTRDLGKGALVVGVEVSAGSIKVTFDSDLVSDTVADGVILVDEKGKRVGGSSTYSNRTVVITGLELAPGATYKLVVLPMVQDVGGRNVPTEYDLTVVGPTAGASTGGQGTVVNPPSPEPSPTPTPSPIESPTP
jgi:Tol biopolymer transport system component